MTTSDFESAAAIATSFLQQPVEELVPILGKGCINAIIRRRAATQTVVLRMNHLLSADVALIEYDKEMRCLQSPLGDPIRS